MSSTGTQIAELMTANGKTAADMTHNLKVLGDGSMQKGLARIGSYFAKEIGRAEAAGLHQGRIQGGLAGIACAALAAGTVWWLCRKEETDPAHEAEGREILRVMETAEAPVSVSEEEADTSTFD